MGPDFTPVYPDSAPPKVIPIPPASSSPPKAVPIPDGTPPASAPPDSSAPPRAIRIPGDSTRHPTGRFSGPNNRTK